MCCAANSAAAAEPGAEAANGDAPPDSARPRWDLHEMFRGHISPSSKILLPSDVNYTTEIRQRWTTWEAPSYIGAIKPTTEEDIATIVKICVANDIAFLATGGGHGAGTGFGKVKNALNIDLSNFTSVELDAERNLLTVGGATLAGQIYEPLYAAGKELPTGRSPCVGLVGLSLGGGIGTLQGKHGLVMDALESVRLVTAAGKVIIVSRKEQPDLFWALRGAGANFGIVTSATYRVFDATNNGQFVNGDFEFEASSNRPLWELIKSFDEDMPAELSIVVGAGYNRVSKTAVLIANAAYSGPIEEAQQYLKGFTALNPTKSSITTVPWPKLTSVAQFGTEWYACQRNQFVNVYTVGLGVIDVPTLGNVFDKFIEFYESHPNYEGRFGFQKYSNKVVASVPESDSVYPWRNIKTQVLFRNMHTDPAIGPEVDKFVRSLRSTLASTSGLGGLQAYINYAHGDEAPETLYGSHNLPRLVELKRKWDPSNAFGKGYPVPLAL